MHAPNRRQLFPLALGGVLALFTVPTAPRAQPAAPAAPPPAMTSAALSAAWAAEKMRAYGLENVRLESYALPMGWDFTNIHKGRMGATDHVPFEQEADLIQGAQVMAVMALRVAQLPGLLPRDKPAGTNPRPSTDTGSHIDEDDPGHEYHH